MRDYEAAMQVYVRLAVISNEKKQPQVRDRFLLLAGVEACRAGWPEVAERCRQQLVTSNPAHQIHRYNSFADALRNEEFQLLAAHWERYCPFENAEAILRGLRLPAPEPSELTVGEQMLQLLGE
jgi:hypothetical protein